MMLSAEEYLAIERAAAYKSEYVDGIMYALVNPTLIVEVLSETTAAFDRGKKFQSYQSIESTMEYLLGAQDETVVEDFLRQRDAQWLYTKATGLDASILLRSIGCELQLRDIYNKIS
jgi:Uma2 family endonuclease